MRQEDVLSVLRHAGRPMTPAEICGELLLDINPTNRAGVSSRLRELKRKGLVRRIPIDGRLHAWEPAEPKNPNKPQQNPKR